MGALELCLRSHAPIWVVPAPAHPPALNSTPTFSRRRQLGDGVLRAVCELEIEAVPGRGVVAASLHRDIHIARCVSSQVQPARLAPRSLHAHMPMPTDVRAHLGTCVTLPTLQLLTLTALE